MILIKRHRNPPATLLSEKVRESFRRLRSLENRTSRDFEPHWNSEDVRVALWEMQHRKCSYCERIRELKYEPDIEHFRPKAGVTECNGENGYWWLAYDWRNLYFSCRICNQKYKKNHFPLTAGSPRASTPEHSLDREQRLLIDPCAEDPEQFFSWDWTRVVGGKRYVFACWREDKGRATVETLGLNHGELAQERGAVVEIVLQLIFDYKRMLEAGVPARNKALQDRKALLLRELASDRPFLALKRFMIRSQDLSYLLEEPHRGQSSLKQQVGNMPTTSVRRRKTREGKRPRNQGKRIR